KWADLMATSGQFYWPSAGSSMAAYGQLVMAADIRHRHRTRDSYYLLGSHASVAYPQRTPPTSE
ncbi:MULTISPECIES: hypothetical protein, partial [unclassified Cryobacterium]|uniref:hypothetical protein n=1 Tax=unclassified Cryobacterium TaxID=2649013 RepID=UPI001A7E6916